MAEFKKLSDVEIVETPIDTANVLIEENGVIKRVPKDEVGGIKVAAAEVGQTIVVKAVDENGNPTEWEAVDKVKSWNDLKDKPFYEEVGKVIYIPETVGTVLDGGNGMNYMEYDSSLIPNWTYDNKLFIKWDGIEYECFCREDSNLGEDVYDVSGDNKVAVTFGSYGRIVSLGTSYLVAGDTHTYEVYTIDTVVKPLDTKYLPEALQFGEKVVENILFNGEVDWEQSSIYTIDNSLSLVEGAELTATLNGVTHKGTAEFDTDQGEICAYMYDTEDNMNFVIFSTYLQNVGHSEGIFPLIIESIVTTLTPLDSKYIEDYVQSYVKAEGIPKNGPYWGYCSNNHVSAVKSVGLTGNYYKITLKSGVMVNVYFDSKNNSSDVLKLNVQNTGAIPISYGNSGFTDIVKGVHGFIFYVDTWIMLY